MAISGVGQSYYQNNVTTMKSTKNVNSTEEFGLEKQAEHRNYQKRKKWNYSKRNSMKTFLKLQTTGQ